MLRAFKGVLYEKNFHEVMAILGVLQHRLRSRFIDREIVAGLWSLCHFAESWGLDKDGMLRRNNLMTEKQVQQLFIWTDCISYTTTMLLEGAAEDIAFESYRDYLNNKQE